MSQAKINESLYRVLFSGESNAYRVARDELFRAEFSLWRALEKLAQQRRKLSPGGTGKEYYVFEEVGDASSMRTTVKLS